jgi:divalent metal cation (Fe/Co/Zn/Cd) transporter
VTEPQRASLLASAVRLSFLTIAWNAVTGGAALAVSIVDGSVSLGGFALNMLIDTAASAVLVWRFKREVRDPIGAEHLERRAQAGIALAMIGVAAYVTIEAVRTLAAGSDPKASPLGISLAVASLLFLPWLARRKWDVAVRLPSRALRGDAVLSAASAALAAVTLAALLAASLLGWTWADPVAGLFIAAALAVEATRLAASFRRGR